MPLKIPTATWKKRDTGHLSIYESVTLAWLPRIIQGYTTRKGGYSQAPYNSLNLGGHVGDNAEDVAANRKRLANDLGFSETHVVRAEQVHGSEVAVITGPNLLPIPGVDALITQVPGLLL